jgi:hypothetical protein
MRFLHPKWNPHLLAISVIELCLSCLPLRATETSNRVVVDAADVDLAKAQSGGEIVFVSSGQRLAAFHAIDCDRRTAFQFSSSDPRPTLIVKLAESKPLHRVSVVVGSEAGKVDVYLLDEISSDPSNLDKMRPLASIVDLAISREAVVDFAPRKARYVMLRWTAKSDRRPLVVAEVSAFSIGVSDPSPVALTASDAPEGPPLIASVSP